MAAENLISKMAPKSDFDLEDRNTIIGILYLEIPGNQWMTKRINGQ